jgi:transcriptional regulator with XRE-family HTH domain
MPANFSWDDAKATVSIAAQGALNQIGTVLYARRLHLNKSQQEIADVANALQTDISALERGVLPATLRAGNEGLRAVLLALEWRAEDVDFMIQVIKEFARFEMV